jgi:hypothetical protein
VQQLEIGSYNDGFTANEFQLLKQYNSRLPGLSWNFHTTVTAKTCVPVQEYFYHTNTSGHIINELSMFTQYVLLLTFSWTCTSCCVSTPHRSCTCSTTCLETITALLKCRGF